MSTGDFLTLATLALAILIVTPFLGRYIHRVMEGERVFLSPILRPVERFVYRVCGIDEKSEQDWKGYTISVLAMAFVAIVAGYIVFRLQDILPFNQGGIPSMSPDLAFNTSVSFETNTNWQNYSGETGATYLTQATVLAVRNFTSAATGLAVAIALIRGLTRRSAKTLGNYWVDLTRGVLYILLPVSIVGAVVLVWQGVPQTWNPTAGRDHPAGCHAEYRHGAHRLAGMDQGDGQQRRGVLQRQLVPSLREPDAADELARDLRPPHDQLLADVHVRPVCPEPAPGLDDLRRDGRDPAGRRGVRHAHRVQRQPALPDGRRPGHARQHGGQGDALRCRRRRTVHDSHDWHQHRSGQLLA